MRLDVPKTFQKSPNTSAQTASNGTDSTTGMPNERDNQVRARRVHDQFVEFGTNAKTWMRKCILLLPEVERYRIWEQKKFGSIYEYAAKLAGMSHNTVDDALRILKKIECMPELQKIAATKGINAIRPVAAIATKDTASFWAKKAAHMSKHTLEVYVKEFTKVFDSKGNPCSDNPLLGTCNDHNEIPRTGTGNNAKNPHQQAISIFDSWRSDHETSQAQQDGSVDHQHGSEAFQVPTQEFVAQQTRTLGSAPSHPSEDASPCDQTYAPNLSQKIVGMELDVEILEQLQKLKGENSWNELMQQLLQIRAAQLEEQKPEAVVTESRHIPAKIKRYVLARTNGICAFPECQKSSAILHHTQRFALEKVHDPSRLQGLCKEHERIAHQGLIENEEHFPKFWKLKKTANQHGSKFIIDQMVEKYRAPI